MADSCQAVARVGRDATYELLTKSLTYAPLMKEVKRTYTWLLVVGDDTTMGCACVAKGGTAAGKSDDWSSHRGDEQPSGEEDPAAGDVGDKVPDIFAVVNRFMN